MKKEKVKEKKSIKVEKPVEEKVLELKRGPTLKEKITGILNLWEKEGKEIEDLEKKLFLFIQKELYPDQFCPECEERLFLNPATGYDCPNCGYKRALGEPVVRPVVRPTTSKIDPKLDKAINNVMHAPRRTGAATKLGAKIKKLVDQRDSGGPTAPTHQDEGMVRRDGNVSGKINWI